MCYFLITAIQYKKTHKITSMMTKKKKCGKFSAHKKTYKTHQRG